MPTEVGERNQSRDVTAFHMTQCDGSARLRAPRRRQRPALCPETAIIIIREVPADTAEGNGPDANERVRAAPGGTGGAFVAAGAANSVPRHQTGRRERDVILSPSMTIGVILSRSPPFDLPYLEKFV